MFDTELTYLCIWELCGDSGIEVGEFLKLVTFENEDLVLEERGESPIEPHPEVLGLRPDLPQYVGIKPGDSSLQRRAPI